MGAVGPCAVCRARWGLRAARRAQRWPGVSPGWLRVPTCPTVCQHSIWAGCSKPCFELLLVAILPFYCWISNAAAGPLWPDRPHTTHPPPTGHRRRPDDAPRPLEGDVLYITIHVHMHGYGYGPPTPHRALPTTLPPHDTYTHHRSTTTAHSTPPQHTTPIPQPQLARRPSRRHDMPAHPPGICKKKKSSVDSLP
jgi:hypothetical protein